MNNQRTKVIRLNVNGKVYVRRKQELRVWYGEDLYDSTESDNSGTSCIEVWANYAKPVLPGGQGMSFIAVLCIIY